MKKWIQRLKADEAKALLDEIIDKLDEADSDDMFGTEGWRHYFGMEEVESA